MSSREPLWFCHECHEEMTPLMVPDPQCSLCNSSFVEKMENLNDDPREFQHHPLADLEPASLPPEIDSFFQSLRHFMDQSSRTPRTPSATNNPDGLSPHRFRFEVRSGPAGNTRTVTIGGPNTLNSRSGGTFPDEVPTMSQFRRDNNPQQEMGITGPLMAQYLAALMGMRGGVDPFGATNQGRWGDYAFTQDALDQIITQLMENSNSTRPVPATEDIILNLPREVLELGSPTLEKECAVCKDQFQLDTADPDEQVVVTLPCLHPFHEGCIIPWLKSSGTCPVCRHALIAQPDNHPTPSGPGRGNSGNSPEPSSQSTRPLPRPGNSSTRDRDMLEALFRFPGGTSREGRGSNSGNGSERARDQRRRRSDDPDHPRLPGGWGEQID